MASIQEVEGLVVGVHQGLLEHDRELLQVQVEREEVEAWHAGERGKVEEHFAAVVARLAAARDAVVEQLGEEALQRRLRQVARAQLLAAASRGLQPELDGLQAALAGDPALLRGPSLADFRIFRIPPQKLRISGFFTLGGYPPT